ncbi:MAG: PilZ domain-containing protein [Deltaproteobacteria bacterium]|nr:MAG: PilZ domain-containing protein [Deltaproteobacteria bacterium]
MTSEIEKRRHPRITADWPVIVLASRQSIGGTVKNISISGASIYCLTDPGLDEPFRIVIKAPPREQALIVTAEPTWARTSNGTGNISSCEIGVRFSRYSSGDLHFLFKAVIDHLKST